MSDEVVIYRQADGTAAVMCPVGDAALVAARDVPAGAPYILCNRSGLPADAPPEAWTVDWSSPDGMGGEEVDNG